MIKNSKYPIFVLIAMALYACNEGDMPADKVVPMTLSSKTESRQTRITGNSQWEGGEQVQVSVNDATAVAFTAAADGTLTPVNTIWWYSATETVSARAWYPDLWVFPTDQSNGTQGADFVFAPTVSGITFRNAGTKSLIFYHKTAKVIVNLTAGMGVNSVADAVVSLYGYISGSVDTSKTGDGTILGFDDGWVTAHNSGGIYSALLIPRNVSGEQFIKITLGGFDYFYIPAAGKADLQPGRSYTYDITLNKTGLDATITGSGVAWDSGDEHTVVGEIVED